MFRFRRSLPQFLRKNSFLTRLKTKLLQDDEEEKQIIPHQQIKQPLNVKQEIEQFISQQTEISDLERIRMRKLDDKLGTNTHFHETETYEERLDSDNVMKRQILAKKDLLREKDLAVAHLFNPDPQLQIHKPWIRNMEIFTSEALKNIPYPQHSKTFQDGDFFRYFEQKHYDVEKVAQFDFYESLYTQLVQLQMLKREETIKNRYYELIDSFQNVPIVFRDYIYVSRDSKEGHPAYNIYRRKNQSNYFQLFNESSNLAHEIITDDDELVLSGKIIADLLPKHYEDLILDIEEEKIQSLYKAFLPNSQHDTFGCIISEGGLSFLIIRSQKLQLILENVTSTFAFHKNYLYYIEKTDIDQQKYILKLNLDKIEERSVVYQIQPGEFASIKNLSEEKAIIEIKKGNENYFLDLNGQIIVPFEQGYQYELDQNKVNTFIAKAKINSKQMNIHTKEGLQIYACQNGFIQGFSTNDFFIALHERDLETSSDKLIILKEKSNHELLIQESKYSINLEQHQIKDSNQIFFQLMCPYKPFQILKYNIDIKSIAVHFSEQFPGFNHNSLLTDNFIISDNYSVCVSFLEELPISFVLIKLIDQEQYQSINQEDVIIYENGGAICQIIVNPSNQTLILENLQKVHNELTALSERIILSTNGALSGLIGSYTHYFTQQFHSLLCHNGLFDNQKKLLNLPISAYDITKVPSLRNAYFSYSLNDDLMYQSQKMVALLRENKDNKVDVKKEYGIILQQCENDIEETILRLTFLLSVV